MNKPTVSSSVNCYIVVPPQYRPQLYTGINHDSRTNLKAAVQYTDRVNENLIPLAGGRTDVFQLGPVRKDILLDITGASAETELVLDEIIERNIPVYIYPRSGGGLQFAMPLVRGLGTDPIDGPTVTYTLTLQTGTTVYMPHADAGHGIYLKAVDTAAPLIDGVQNTNGIMVQLPTGRGIPIWKKRTNYILNSLMSFITHEVPYSKGNEWGAYTTASDVWGTDHGIKSSPWCADANSYWTTSTTTYLRGYTFPSSLLSLTVKSLSFCYRVDGIMNVSIKDPTGTNRYSINITAGSGREILDLTGSASSYFKCYIKVALVSGNYCEFSCPQFIEEPTLDSSQYFPFLGTSSASVSAEITDCSLVVQNLDTGADAVPFSITAGDRDGAMLISGYCQPLFDGDYVSSSNLQTIVQAFGYGASIKLNVGYDGSSGLEFALYSNATERQVAAISEHKLGDIYAFGLWSGYADGTANTQMRLVRLRDGATYVGSYIGSLFTCHTLYVGCDAGTAQSDCILSAVTVEALDNDDCPAAVDRLADEAVRNVFRNSWGRWYHLTKATSPRANGEAHLSTGQYIGTEVRAI